MITRFLPQKISEKTFTALRIPCLHRSGLDMHTVSIALSGEVPEIKLNPPNDSVRVNFNPQGKLGIRQIDDATYEVSGNFSNRTKIRKRFPLRNPSAYAAGTFKTLLKEKGIEVEGVIKTGTVPSDAAAIYTVKSKTSKTLSGTLTTTASMSWRRIFFSSSAQKDMARREQKRRESLQ